MPLPTFADAKLYLRIEDSDEDQLVTQLVARAKAQIETFIGYPFTAVEKTFVEYRAGCALGGDFIQLPGPFALSPAPAVTDPSGGVIDTTSYVLDPAAGKIRAKDRGYFGSRPITVVATIGLSAHPDYASRLEAVASIAIIDLVADLYQNRNPNVSSSQDEGGGSFAMSGIGHVDSIPPRVMQSIMILPCTAGLLLA